MLSLTRLRHIVAVARTGSFSVAAEDVGISQPALSRSIQAFEEEYGLRLFNRGKGGVTLTPAGRLAVDQARALLSSATDFDRGMRLFGRGEAGQTGVGMGPLMASLLLPQIGASLFQRSSKLKVSTKVGPPDQMLEALIDGTIELIIGNSWQLSLVPGVVEERLGVLALTFVARAGHPLTKHSRLTMSDLESFPAARAFDYGTGGQTARSGAFICENFTILRDVVLNTDCMCLVSPALFKTELAQGQLVNLDVDDAPTHSTQTNLVYLRGRARSPASLMIAEIARAMIDDLSIIK